MSELPAAQPSIGAALLGVAAVAMVSILCAWSLRRLRLSGSGVLGGIAAGVLLGPLVLGRVAPATHVAVFEGSPELRVAARTAERSLDALKVAAGAALANADVDAARLAGKRDVARRAFEDARRDHQRAFHWAMLGIAAWLLGTTAARGATPRRPTTSDVVLGVWCAVVPAGLVLLTARLLGLDPLSPNALSVAAIMACGAWRVEREELAIARSIGGDTGRAMLTAGLVATALALLALLILAFRFGSHWLGATMAIVSGGVGALIARRVPRRALVFGTAVAVPTASGLLVVLVDPAAATSFFLLILVFLIAEDGRWLGAWLGRTLAGESGATAIRTALAGLNVAPTMLALSAIAAASGILSPDSAIACVVAGFLLAFFAPARLRVAQRLEGMP